MRKTTAAAAAQGLTAAANRYATPIQWVSFVLILVSVALVVRQLPFGPVVAALEGSVEALGFWGPVVFGLVYVVAVILLFPASALTLIAGAIFGLLIGTIVVSLASTTGAAFAFLIGRYLARDRVVRQVQQYPRIDAIDRAVSAGGWRIVALLRLSPAVPFNVQNYLYGVTGIGFWTCGLTSWIAMLPGTFLYVYLGSVGRAGLEAASGGHTRTPAEWALIAIGLVATVAVTVYVTRLARQALKERTRDGGGSASNTNDPAERIAKGWPWGATLTALAALAALGAAVFLQFNPSSLR